jgi:Ca2+-binding EF-hand superfamily protein
MIIEKMFAELEIDDVMFDDEDGDFVMDPVDDCPGTPYGTVVDTLGCPLDIDNDGIPDYLDLEPDSRPGVWVDADGKTITEEDYLKRLLNRSEAMTRAEVKQYFETIGQGYVRKAVTEIPEKFKKLDSNKDGYIAFEELLQAIDYYFDFKLDFKVEDIYELNNFFFEQ